MRTISVARDFSRFPAGRFYSDGPDTGQRFREELLLPALRASEHVTVDLDNTAGYGSSFLEEGFGGLVRAGFSEAMLKAKLTIKASRKSYVSEAWRYIADEERKRVAHSRS